jgi:hypothetical protein
MNIAEAGMADKGQRERREKMAQGVAAGLSPREAATAAGYAPGSRAYEKVRRSGAFLDRVTRLRLGRGGKGELAPAIDRLMEGAAVALGAAHPSAARLAAAGALMAEAARLQRHGPGAARRGRLSDPVAEEMSADEWAATYGPAS